MIRITEDPVYGTPVFKTIGGQSQCPGETATSRRQSNVQIMEIVPQCGPDSNAICDVTTLAEGAKANFAVVIYNDSPTGLFLVNKNILYIIFSFCISSTTPGSFKIFSNHRQLPPTV